MLPILGFLLLSAFGATGALAKTLPLTLEPGTTTECKACPYTGCVNKAYPEGANITGTCWTSGQAINNLTLWVKTTDNCYFNEWDLKDQGDIRANLTSCGHVEPIIAEATGTTKYVAECQVHPTMDWSEYVYTAKWYKQDVDLTFTCKSTPPLSEYEVVDIFGDRTWYRTKYSYCFVHQKLLKNLDGVKNLPDCGPIPPFLNTGNRNPDPEARKLNMAKKLRPWSKVLPKTTPRKKKPVAATPPAAPQAKRDDDVHQFARRGLFNNTIAEDGVVCRADPINNSSAIIKRYPYGRHIIAQCGEYLDQLGLSDIGIYTTDFCWIHDSQLDIMIEDETNNIKEYLKYCDYYVDTEEWVPTDTWGCGLTVDC